MMETLLQARKVQRESLQTGLCLSARATGADLALFTARHSNRNEIVAHWPPREGPGGYGEDASITLAAFAGDRPVETGDIRLPAVVPAFLGARPHAAWSSDIIEAGGRDHRLLLFWRRNPEHSDGALADAAIHISALLRDSLVDPIQARRWARLASVLDALPTAVIYFDDAGGDVIANAQALALLSLDEAAATNTAVAERLRELEPVIGGALDELRASDCARHTDVDCDGRVFSVGTVPLSNDRGGGRMWTLQDVTEARRQQHSLFEAKRLAVLGQIAGGVGHEFNNLLGKIIGSAEMTMEHLPDDPQAHAELETLITIAEQSAGVVRRLSAYSCRSVAEPRLFDLSALIRRFEAADGELDEERITLRCAVPDEPLWAVVDDKLIEAAIIAVIVNAADCGARQVTLTAARGSSCEAEITIEDDGPGMGEDVLVRAFDPFFTTKPVGEGVGLGLSMVRGVMEQFGGRAALRNANGAGLTVRLALPLANGPDALVRPTSGGIQRQDMPRRPSVW